MSERCRFIKVRVTDAEYRELRKRADEHGLTMSEHVRGAVTTVHQAVDVVAELGKLRHQLRQSTDAGEGHTAPGDSGQREVLLLVRELAAARDAQILARVRAQLAAYPGTSSQGGGGR